MGKIKDMKNAFYSKGNKILLKYQYTLFRN